jgi:hypothetical protein
MRRKAFSLFLALLLVAGLAALAQSPTSSNPGGSETKDPYGATLDHPNPGSAPAATGQPYNANKVNEGQTPASGTTTATGTATTEPSSTSTTPSTSTETTTPSESSGTTSTTTGSKLPRTASDLPLLATIGLLALGGALTVRSIARRNS